MPSTLRGLLLDRTPQKLEAICGGLALSALALFAMWVSGLDRRIPWVVLDDFVFGRQSSQVGAFLLAEAGLMLSVVVLLPRRPLGTACLGLVGATSLLVETLFDLQTFGADPRLWCEELAFVIIYATLIALLAAHGLPQLGRAKKAPLKLPPLACGDSAPRDSAAPSAAP
jgi:hypothetical protein